MCFRVCKLARGVLKKFLLRDNRVFPPISGAYNLLQLDLSVNFLQEFPNEAVRLLTDLRFLNISNNLITVSGHDIYVEIFERFHSYTLLDSRFLFVPSRAWTGRNCRD